MYVCYDNDSIHFEQSFYILTYKIFTTLPMYFT